MDGRQDSGAPNASTGKGDGSTTKVVRDGIIGEKRKTGNTSDKSKQAPGKPAQGKGH